MTKCNRNKARTQESSPRPWPLHTGRAEQITFSFGDTVKPTLVFDAEEITTDAGLAPLRELDERLGLIEMAAAKIEDYRRPDMVVHPLERLLREEVFAFAAGYEDANDHTSLQNEPFFKQIIGPVNAQSVNPKAHDGLASEATISRLLGRQKLELAEDFGSIHVEQFARVLGRHQPKVLTLDIDGYDASTHGDQQYTLFNAYYDQHMYYPLHVSIAEYGFIVGVQLREGDAGPGTGAVPLLRPILEELSRRLPGTRLRVRADSGFAAPDVYRLCEAFGVEYVIRLKLNDVLKERFAEHLAWRVYGERPDETRDGCKVFYYKTKYKAGSWKRARTVVLKLVYDPESGEESQYVIVTNMQDTERKSWRCYEHRGQEEQRIDELKNHLRGEKFSCSEMADNAFKLHLIAMAHNLYAALRIFLPEHHELKRATVSRLRLNVVKCAAMVRLTARRLWLHASRHWPYKSLLVEACRCVVASRLQPSPLWRSG